MKEIVVECFGEIQNVPTFDKQTKKTVEVTKRVYHPLFDKRLTLIPEARGEMMDKLKVINEQGYQVGMTKRLLDVQYLGLEKVEEIADTPLNTYRLRYVESDISKIPLDA